MKKAICLLLMFVLAAATQAQEELDYSFPVKFKGKSPVISDFVTALVTYQEDPGELQAYVGSQWRKYRRGKDYDGRFTVDTRHGYVRYDQQEENVTTLTEFCYWRCTDKRQVVVAINTSSFRDGIAFDGQYSGVSLYVYDTKTRRMELVPLYTLGMEIPEIDTFLVYSLPVKGKDITATANGGEYRCVYVWNGKGFDLKEEK